MKKLLQKLQWALTGVELAAAMKIMTRHAEEPDTVSYEAFATWWNKTTGKGKAKEKGGNAWEKGGGEEDVLAVVRLTDCRVIPARSGGQLDLTSKQRKRYPHLFHVYHEDWHPTLGHDQCYTFAAEDAAAKETWIHSLQLNVDYDLTADGMVMAEGLPLGSLDVVLRSKQCFRG